MANLELVAVDKSPKKSKKETEDARRDEWSNDGINSLLDVYEAKWNQRNRGNLKGGDWVDVAECVSSRCGGTRSLKSPFQCKNKVASMKQKYRSETLLKGISGSTSSRWPFYTRLDAMLRRVPTKIEDAIHADGIPEVGVAQVVMADLRLQEALPQVESLESEQAVTRRGQDLFIPQPPQENLKSSEGVAQNRDSNQEDASNTLPQRKISGQGSDTITPRSKAANMHGVYNRASNKHRNVFGRDMATSIFQFVDSILKLEEAKMEMFKDSERLRAEAEARRVDMELKRTEIIMNTQLQIVKLLSRNSPRKRKARRTVPVPTSDNVTSAGQSSLQIHPLDQSTLSTPASHSFQANPSGYPCPALALQQPLQCAVQSELC